MGLILTRGVRETVVIDLGEGRIHLSPLEVRSNRVRLLIEAPDHVKIFRRELVDREQKKGGRPEAPSGRGHEADQ
jgi:carbon storage regulator CsrA